MFTVTVSVCNIKSCKQKIEYDKPQKLTKILKNRKAGNKRKKLEPLCMLVSK